MSRLVRKLGRSVRDIPPGAAGVTPSGGLPGPNAGPPSNNGPIADYLERVTKYVPVEIVGAYLAIRGVVPDRVLHAQDAWPVAVEIMLFAALVALTPLYLWRFGGSAPQRSRQLVIATISFVVWAYAIGGPFFWNAVVEITHRPGILNPGFGGVLAVIWSLAAGLFQPSASN